MDGRELERRKAAIEDKYGLWTGYSIALGDGVYTSPPSVDTRLRRIVQTAGDLLGYPFAGRRVLDLACGEGQLAIEFALHGAKVVAIEGRAANLEKAKFAAESLGVNNVELLLEDVRDLSVERHGKFDLVLCAGILYHLDAPDVMDFVQRVADACQGVAIFDTHITPWEWNHFEWHGRTYWGSFVEEHPPKASAAEVKASLWYSLDNKRAFNFTRDSLCNLLRHAGFTSVFESLVPYEVHHADWPMRADWTKKNRLTELKNRITLIGLKGERRPLLSSPMTESQPEFDRFERSKIEGRLERSGRFGGRVLDRLMNRFSARKISGGLVRGVRPTSPDPQH